MSFPQTLIVALKAVVSGATLDHTSRESSNALFSSHVLLTTQIVAVKLDVSGATLSSLYLRKGSDACYQRMPLSHTLIAALTVIVVGANLSSLISRKTSNAWNRTTNRVATVWTCT